MSCVDGYKIIEMFRACGWNSRILHLVGPPSRDIDSEKYIKDGYSNLETFGRTYLG